MQRAAARAVNLADFQACGNVTLLELIAACDPFNPKPSWPALREQLCLWGTTGVIDNASHALFPEQPDQVAEAVLS